MKEIEKMELPYEVGDPGTTWKDGLCVRMDEGKKHTSLFILHETREVETREVTVDDDGNETETVGTETRVYAFQVRVEKPLTRAKAISAAEKAAYNLRSAEDVAAFAASMARKARTGEDEDEVTDHDEFIAAVKEALTAIGI